MRGVLAIAGVALIGSIFFLRQNSDPQSSPHEPQKKAEIPQSVSATMNWPRLQFTAETKIVPETSPSESALQKSILGKTVVPAAGKPATETAIKKEGPRAEAQKFAAFRKAYPVHYIETLKDWQDLVGKTDPEQASSYTFSNETEVFSFLDSFIDYANERGILEEEMVPSLKAGLYGPFKKEKNREQERVTWNPPPPERLAWLKKLTAYLLPERAFALAWQTVPQCYKNTGSAAPGSTLFAPTCNAGIKFVPTPSGVPVPVAIPDCGPGGLLCDQPLGCLNAVCLGRPNAIYERVTGICGCG